MILLVFFALPLATILLAIVLEKILHCPILVTITFFAIYLIILFALFATGVITDLAVGLIAIIIYTIIAFITASIVRIIKVICERCFNHCERCSIGRNCCCRCWENNDETSNSNQDLLRISCRCNNGNSQDLLTVNSNCLNAQEEDNDNNGNNNCRCGRNHNNDTVTNNNRNFTNWKCNTKSIQ